MYYRANVIFPDEIGHKVILLGKVVVPATGDPVVVDGDDLIPVFSRVFMPEPNSVHQLMDHTAQKIYVKIGHYSLLVKTKVFAYNREIA